jgi:hypothetical protein
LNLEAVKILSQCTLIINGNETATAKLEAFCAILLTYDDESDFERITKVDLQPATASTEGHEYRIGNRKV